MNETRLPKGRARGDLRILIFTTVLCLLPMVIGLVLYDRLPQEIPTHFTFRGEADGWSSRTAAVFGLPGLTAGLNVLVQVLLVVDPKKANLSGRLRSVCNWLLPAASLGVGTMTLGSAVGLGLWAARLIPALAGVLLLMAVSFWLPRRRGKS